jgi:ABC-type multidrug transport system ATPase subunit
MTEPRTETETAPILTVSGLAQSYGRTDVLEDISVEIDPGAVTAIIGPNGSGKTTFIRSLVGLEQPTDGEITYHGPDAPRPIGYLQQRPEFRPGQTVREAISFYGSLVGETAADATARLERVGIAAAKHRRVEALSGGMTRLVGIAQATVGDPPLVVLDEPASGLDPGMSVRIFEVVDELADDGAAVLLSSHDLGLVERTADRVVLIDEGSIARTGSPDELLEGLGVDSLLEAFEAVVSGDVGRVRVRGETA